MSSRISFPYTARWFVRGLPRWYWWHLLQILSYTIFKAISRSEQDDTHKNAPGYAEPCQESTQLVLLYRLEDLLPLIYVENAHGVNFIRSLIILPDIVVFVLSIHFIAVDLPIFQVNDPVGGMGYVVLVGDDQDGDPGPVDLLQQFHNFQGSL